jgi:hypothetical protein
MLARVQRRRARISYITATKTDAPTSAAIFNKYKLYFYNYNTVMNRLDKEITKKREKVEHVVKEERFKRQELCVLVNDG